MIVKSVNVSVIVPVYNRRDVLRRCVESLISQEFAYSFEIIVVDDGSTDGGAEGIEELCTRIRVVRQPNQGAAAARRAGILAARSDIVAFLDSDDVANHDYLSKLWHGLHRRSDVVLAWGRVVDLEGVPFPCEQQPRVTNRDGVLDDPFLALLSVGCFTSSMCLMTRRDLAEKATAGRERFLAANDFDFTLRLSLNGAFAFVDATLIRCERRDDGITRTRRLQQGAFALIAAGDAFAASGRRDSASRLALRRRLEAGWPFAFVQAAKARELKLCASLATVGIRYAPTYRALKEFYWAVSNLFGCGRKTIGPYAAIPKTEAR